jgi:hypothetical protein
MEFRAVLSAVYGKGKDNLSRIEDLPYLEAFPKLYEGYWYRSVFSPSGMTAEEFIKRLGADHPPILMPKWAEFNGGRFEIIGVRVPEELGWRTLGESWIFILRLENRLRANKRSPVRTFFIRTGRASRPQMLARIPELSLMASKKIALIGLGCMGAPSALEFARAGVGELRFVPIRLTPKTTTYRLVPLQ